MNITKCDWSPSGKWDCGIFTFTIETPVGTIEVEDVVPGPQHGDDSRYTTIKINGEEKDLDFDFDFGQPTVWSDEERLAVSFRENMQENALQEMQRFVEAFQAGQLGE